MCDIDLRKPQSVTLCLILSCGRVFQPKNFLIISDGNSGSLPNAHMAAPDAANRTGQLHYNKEPICSLVRVPYLIFTHTHTKKLFAAGLRLKNIVY